MVKNLAIQFWGHSQFFRQTYKNFKKNIIDVNSQNGWKIDIFIHIEELLEKYGFENYEYFIKHYWDNIKIDLLVLNYIFGIHWNINRNIFDKLHKWWRFL